MTLVDVLTHPAILRRKRRGIRPEEINAQNQVQVVDISNNPFVRPELEGLVSGLAWIRNPENDYPIRGTYK